MFGVVSNQQLYVDVDVQGLDPGLENGQSYLLWLMVGDSAGYPIDRLDADENGSFSGRLAVPTPIAVAVGNQAQSVRVSSTSVSDLQAEIKQAAKQKVPILPFTGNRARLRRHPPGQGEAEAGGRLRPSSLPGFMIPAGSRRDLAPSRVSMPSSPISAAM